MPRYRDIVVLIIALGLIRCAENNEPIKTDAAEKNKSETQIKSVKDTVSKELTPEIKEEEPAKEQTSKENTTESNKESDDSIPKIKSISELWNTYKKAKDQVDKALESGDIKAVINNLKIAGECAIELSRNDIAAWQFNNVGHYSIEEFKKRTGCDNKIRFLAIMQSGDEKEKLLNETKELFRKEIDLLIQAESSLQRAQIIDDELEKSRRSEVIQSNLEFVAWVKDFIQ